MTIAGLRYLNAAKPFRNSLLARSAGAWLIVRIFAAYAELGITNPALPPFIALIASGIVMVDLRRRGDVVFLGNLGIPGSALWLTGAVLPLILDTTIVALGMLLR